MLDRDFFERILRTCGYGLVAGMDEVGRGALAGPVVAAAVILDGNGDYREFRDSKAMSVRARGRAAERIRETALGIGIGSASERDVDRINVFEATKMAMREAVARLPVRPDVILVDGFRLSGLDSLCIGIVDGDACSYSIAAASIVAKVHRDGLMRQLAEEYPGYGFEQNKGYGSEFHRRAIVAHGPCPSHRQTFGIVREMNSPRGDHGR